MNNWPPTVALPLLFLLTIFCNTEARAATGVLAHEFYGSHSHEGQMFFTVDNDEANAIRQYRKNDWNEIIGQFYVFDHPVQGLVPLYRYVHAKSGDHFFTIDHQEGSEAVKSYGYKEEGICCYVSPTPMPGATPLYRVQKTIHWYTFIPLNRDEKIIKEGFTNEGIAAYVWAGYDRNAAGYAPLPAPTLPGK